MIKMIIKLDEEKIDNNGNYSKDRINAALDRIFERTGMDKVSTAKGIEYRGHNNPSDFARFGKVMLGLKDQAWFMDNALVWILCNSDDSDDPEVFDEEDLLAHYSKNVVA